MLKKELYLLRRTIRRKILEVFSIFSNFLETLIERRFVKIALCMSGRLVFLKVRGRRKQEWQISGEKNCMYRQKHFIFVKHITTENNDETVVH